MVIEKIKLRKLTDLRAVFMGTKSYLGGARRAGSTAGGDGRQGCREGLAEGGAPVRVAGSEAEDTWCLPARERLCSPKDQHAEEDLKGVVAEVEDAQTQPSVPVPVPAPVLDAEPAEPAPKKKRLARLEKRREARVRATAGGGGDRGSAEPQAAVTGRRVLIGREVLVYWAEQGLLDVDAFNLLGVWNRRGTDSVCPTTSTVTSPAAMLYLAFIARLYHGIEATGCQAERIFQRSPTSLMTCSVACLQVKSSACCSFG